MGRYSETDVTWSSIEKFYRDSNVTWTVRSNGIPKYALYDKNGEKIDIDFDMCLNISE